MPKVKKLSESEILHLAQLAGLTLSKEEVMKYKKQLTETLKYVENLNSIQTGDISPADHVINVTNVLFDDGEKNKRKLSNQEVFSNAKKKQTDYFAVERIL